MIHRLKAELQTKPPSLLPCADAIHTYSMARLSAESRSRELKPEQKVAAHTLDRHVSVTAGPGAGKTTVLVERYLQILRTQKVSVDNIVAITFTNRAANEMRERVRREIDNLLDLTSGDERQRWLRHKRTLEAAAISTIHGFCYRLLHDFPVEANIDPQFLLLDEHQAAMMLDAIVEETLTQAIQHGNDRVVYMTQGVGGRSALAAALSELYLKYRGAGLSISDIEERTRTHHATGDQYYEALGKLDACMQKLLSSGRLSKGAEEKRSKAAAQWPALSELIAEPPTEKNIASYCQAIEDFRELRLSKGTHPLVERLDELLWGEKATASDCLRGEVPSLGFDLLAREYALALLKLLRAIDERLESEKQRLSVLDFDDLQLRTLKLLNEHPQVLTRISERYRFFLVDEFQDTNGLQRDLMKKLATARGSNLFIVGDRKQSIYGFRGADVDVFREMTEAMEALGGKQQPLRQNFRSQQPLIDSFNFLFAQIFKTRAAISESELGQLGYVEHEPSRPERGTEHDPPLVELLVSILTESEKSAGESEDAEDRGELPGVRERDATQIVERIKALVDFGSFNFGDIAILFRALTGVWVYESALRRAGIPYLTVQGKGFYQREEVTDLVQLLRFLDNTTDELALAAVLRSPLCGISDNALLALRCAPHTGEKVQAEKLHRRRLLHALRRHREIQFIADEEHHDLERASVFLDSLIQRRNRYRISELLRFAVSAGDFLTVIAANFDGAQRIANVEKLFRLAEQFEKSGQLIRDFVQYVEEFESIGGREGEGQMDKSANVVRLMTVHQAKGLEFPIVIIPDLQRKLDIRESWHVLDRHRGLTVRVPDGRGQTVRGALFNDLRQRLRWREEFESMRLLYVAATRAEDRLIFSGAVPAKDVRHLGETNREQWLAWIWQALELDEHAGSGLVEFAGNAQFQVTLDRERKSRAPFSTIASTRQSDTAGKAIDSAQPLEEIFPLLRPVVPDPGALRRFSVTQLINFQRCARQYYFDRMLRAPGLEERAVWNDAESPEPPANLTATLKGAVIHRFCETFREGDDPELRLQASFEGVVSQRQAELAGRVFDIDKVEAVRALMPLAQHYLASKVFKRVSHAERISAEQAVNNSQFAIRSPQSSPGLWSELRFRLRRSQGILTGTIDKLLITPAANGDGLDVEIIDFKTNRFSSTPKTMSKKSRSVAAVSQTATTISGAGNQIRSSTQGLLNFEVPEGVDSQNVEPPDEPTEKSISIDDQVNALAADYQLQMQAYALALRELLGYTTKTRPSSGRVTQTKDLKINSLRATLHFLDPNVEMSLPSSLMEHGNCAKAIDDAMKAIASLDGTLDPDNFPPFPAVHCRICNFRDLCPAGREWLRLQNHSQ